MFVMCGKQQIVPPSYKTYDTRWLRESTMRQLLLAHVVGNESNDARMALNNAEFIASDVVEHIDDEVSSSGCKRKRTLGRSEPVLPIYWTRVCI